MIKPYLTTIACIGLALTSFAQTKATSAQTIKESLQQKATMMETSIVKNVPFENIGPTVMSGRVVDVDVNPNMPSEFYVAYASGGLWYTHNNGTTFTPIMDNSDTQNLGDIAVDWKNGTIWVGTGENNSSRSSYAGIGILKSTDKGETWVNKGLLDSHHIGRIHINPNNPDEVVVAAVGHLYSENEERGVYKTTDGGTTWNKTLYVNSESGIIDLAVSPENFNIQFAASWDKDRKAWNFDGSGEGSGIYKSTDAGNTWENISLKGSGFPTGQGVGRIGLAVYDDNTVYAVHDSQFRREKTSKNEDNTSGKLKKDDFKAMTAQTFLSLEDKKLNAYLKENGFQEKYRAENVKQMVRTGSVKPVDLAKYLEDANSLLFDTPVVGAEVYRSNDGGKSWTKMNEDYIDDLFYSYGYYFAQIQVNPKNKDHIYISGVPILKSKDGGKTFISISAENVHADHHALWINPNNPNHLINGNDGGVNITYDDGENWIKANQPSVGQFYAIQVDNETPYNVYGGLQDNGVWVGAHNAPEDKSWHQEGQYPWKSIMGGDGMQIQVDNRNHNIVYTGFQFGNYFRINRETGEQAYIQPKHELGETPYRFNWQTPILLSSHNQDILYLGGNKLMRSMNQGKDFTAISGDLTNGGKKGNVAYGTLTTIDESEFQFGLLYTGSDDGLVHVSNNAGGNWRNISKTLPQDLWVSRVEASSHKKERVYVTLNGYRFDDFGAYVYMSNDYGTTWEDISSNLPASPINVIVEDPENEDVLYLGTDNGAYVSFNNGEKWEAFSEGLPNVAVHDIKIQTEAKDLLLGTHGRSIYKTNIEPLQSFDSNNDNTLIVYEIEDIRKSSRWGSSWSSWLDAYEPSLPIKFYTNANGDYTLKVLSKDDKTLFSKTINASKGFNYANYNLTLSDSGVKHLRKEDKDLNLEKASNGNYYLPKGTYTIEISGNGKKQTNLFKVK
ncbi:glycosyl hydrolase [Croceibacter atlanticus]|uniref:WD40/YVTN/BNR-like repeat-containing protein n=1 Tax=Croceibacter atlanticus TaxID=313588 RepID=UPI0030F9EAD7